MLEKLAHFDREVIPERRMHAKGSGAYGSFTVTHDITRYTRAKLFSEVGKKDRSVCPLHHRGGRTRRGRCRLGVNHHQIPVNKPRCPVHSYHCDRARGLRPL